MINKRLGNCKKCGISFSELKYIMMTSDTKPYPKCFDGSINHDFENLELK